MRERLGGIESQADNGYFKRAADGPGALRPLNSPTRFVYDPLPTTVESFSSIGRFTPTIYELDHSSLETAILFHNAISAAQRANKYGAAVHAYGPEEYSGMRMFLTGDQSAGFALRGDEIVSVFRNPSLPRSAPCVDALLLVAVREGGWRLNAFDTILPAIYASHGFTVIARERWEDRFTPSGWDKSTFAEWNNGEPDLVHMIYAPSGLRTIGGRIAQRASRGNRMALAPSGSSSPS